MTSVFGPSHFTRGPPGDGNERNPKTGQHDPHGSIWDICGIFDSRLEVESTIVARQKTGETDQHLAERRVDIKVKVPVDVVRSEFSKVCLSGISPSPSHRHRIADLIPDDVVGSSDSPESSKHGKNRIHRSPYPFLILDNQPLLLHSALTPCETGTITDPSWYTPLPRWESSSSAVSRTHSKALPILPRIVIQQLLPF
jgi:hypothetical protein